MYIIKFAKFMWSDESKYRHYPMHIQVVIALYNAGANPMIKDNRGDTTLSIARKNEDWVLVAILECFEDVWKKGNPNLAARVIQNAMRRHLQKQKHFYRALY